MIAYYPVVWVFPGHLTNVIVKKITDSINLVIENLLDIRPETGSDLFKDQL